MKALFNNIAIIYEIEKLALAALLTASPANAAVSDNLDTVYTKLLVWLGFEEESYTPSTEEFDTAILEDDGANYSTVLYFNFSGNCRLDYKLLSSSGQEILGYVL